MLYKRLLKDNFHLELQKQSTTFLNHEINNANTLPHFLFSQLNFYHIIDWTIKENVRAKLKIAVKRILRKYSYPPDMQLLATETVLKQAEMIAGEIAG